MAQITRINLGDALTMKILSPSFKAALVIIIDPPPPGRGLLQHPQCAAVELGKAVRRTVVLALCMRVYAVQEAPRQIVVVVYGGRELLEHGDGRFVQFLQRARIEVRLAFPLRVELLVCNACQELIQDLGRGLCLEAQLVRAQVRVVGCRLLAVHRVVHNLRYLKQFCPGALVEIGPATLLRLGAVKVFARARLHLVRAGALKVTDRARAEDVHHAAAPPPQCLVAWPRGP